MAFPTVADFNPKNKVTQQQAIKWKEVPTDVYKIVKYTIINTKYGKSLILTLENKDGDCIKCFTPKIMMENEKFSSCNFICVYDEENNFKPYNFK